MNALFVTNLEASAAVAGQGSSMTTIIMMVGLFAVMYFFMIRPQQKKQKELVKFRNSLQKGDKIVTGGGIYGTVKEVNDFTLTVEIANGINIKVDKVMIVAAPSETAK